MTGDIYVLLPMRPGRAGHAAAMTLLGIDHVAYVVTEMRTAVRSTRSLRPARGRGNPRPDFVAMSWGANVHDIALIKARQRWWRGSPRGDHPRWRSGGTARIRKAAARLGDTLEMALDHKVSQSVDFRDPDVNFNEVFTDQPSEQWEHFRGRDLRRAAVALIRQRRQVRTATSAVCAEGSRCASRPCGVRGRGARRSPCW